MVVLTPAGYVFFLQGSPKIETSTPMKIVANQANHSTFWGCHDVWFWKMVQLRYLAIPPSLLSISAPLRPRRSSAQHRHWCGSGLVDGAIGRFCSGLILSGLASLSLSESGTDIQRWRKATRGKWALNRWSLAFSKELSAWPVGHCWFVHVWDFIAKVIEEPVSKRTDQLIKIM